MSAFPGYSKSLFSNVGGDTSLKTLNGLGGLGGVGGGGGFGGGVFTTDFIESLRLIETKYTSNLAGKTYSRIPQDYLDFAGLYAKVAKLALITTDANLSLLLKITEEGLQGAMNALGLSVDLIQSNLAQIELQNLVNQYQSQANITDTLSNGGQLSITQTFTLVPVYSYYVLLYGLPAYGQGFDPVKVAYLVQVLENFGIAPYG
jgi:hypothetical protein